jgi:hypothetical protein
MKFFIGSLLIILLSLSVTGAFSGEAAALDNESLLLASELELAKKPIIYFIFNLKDKQVLLKARGIVLKSMKIEDASFWGDPIDTKPRLLLKKSALFEPKRENIDPNKNKEEETSSGADTTAPAGTFKIDALELTDMPTSYRIEFSEGIYVSVRPKKAGFVSGVYSAASHFGWYISRPVLTLWNSFQDRPFTSIYLTVSEEDARSIYWSLVEKSENIIYQP